jgi:hypothetical protein
MLDFLAGLQAESGALSEALANWQSALSRDPPLATADAIRQRMRQTLERVMAGSPQATDPVTAFALHSGYSEGLPSAPAGEVEHVLAGRLRDSGLPETAASLQADGADDEVLTARVTPTGLAVPSGEDSTLGAMVQAAGPASAGSATAVVADLEHRLAKLRDGLTAIRRP